MSHSSEGAISMINQPFSMQTTATEDKIGELGMGN